MTPAMFAKCLTSAMLTIVAVIHMLPVTGVAGNVRLAALYGLTPGNPNTEILLRHRAVLFGLLGAFLLHAAFRQSRQPLALAAGFISVVSFLWLAHSVGACNSNLARVFAADIVALACLAVGSVSYLAQIPD